MIINSLRLFFTHPQTRSIGILFGIISILFSSWVTRLPDIQLKLRLAESELGYSLLGMSIGSLLVAPLSAWWLTRTTLGKGNLMSSLFYCLTFILPILAYNFNYLLIAMIIVGISHGYMQFMVNAAAASIEQNLQRKIMSTSHGMYSVGLMLGASSSSLLAGWGVSPEVHLSLLCLSMILLSLFLRPSLLSFPENPLSVTPLKWPGKPIMGVVVLGFGFMFSEGVVMDWSSVYIKNTLQSSAFLAGLGITGFSLMMAIGRFAGDSLMSLWSPKALIFWGGIIGAAGLLIAAISTNPISAIIGFSIMGIGYSVIAPILFSIAAQTPGVHPSSGIAAITIAITLGILVSRPLCGLIGEAFGMSASVALGAAVSFIAAFGSRGIRV